MNKRLYPYQSIFSWRPLRKLFYKAGHGIHSPLAYYLVSQVIACENTFYAFEYLNKDYPKVCKHQKGIGQLLFRLIAPVGRESFGYYINVDQVPLIAWGIEASPYAHHHIFAPLDEHDAIDKAIKNYIAKRPFEVNYQLHDVTQACPERYPVCYCNSLNDLEIYLKTIEQAPDRRRNILLDGIRKNKKVYQQFDNLIKTNNDIKLVIDLYNSALIVTGPKLPRQIHRAYLK